MELAEKAFFAQRRNDPLAIVYFKEALEQESKAAFLLFDQFDLEPSRSVLFRSAAFLAISCKAFREAERLACAGLAGRPPAEIRGELKDALNQAMFYQTLEGRL